MTAPTNHVGHQENSRDRYEPVMHLVTDSGLACGVRNGYGESPRLRWTADTALVTCGNCRRTPTIQGDRPCRRIKADGQPCGRIIPAGKRAHICEQCWTDDWNAKHPTYQRDAKRVIATPERKTTRAEQARADRRDPVKGPSIRRRERETRHRKGGGVGKPRGPYRGQA